MASTHDYYIEAGPGPPHSHRNCALFWLAPRIDYRCDLSCKYPRQRARINIWLGWALSCSRWSPLINIPLHKFPRPVSQPHSNNNTDYRCTGWCIDMMGRHGLLVFKTISINDNVTQWVNVESGPLRLKRVLLFIPLKNSLFHPTRRIISFWVGVKKEFSLFSFLYSPGVVLVLHFKKSTS